MLLIWRRPASGQEDGRGAAFPSVRCSGSAAAAQRQPPDGASARPGGQAEGGERERTDRDDDTDTA